MLPARMTYTKLLQLTLEGSYVIKVVVLCARACHVRRVAVVRRWFAGSSTDIDSSVVQHQSRIFINKQKEKGRTKNENVGITNTGTSKCKPLTHSTTQRDSAILLFSFPTARKDSIVARIKAIDPSPEHGNLTSLTNFFA